MYNLASDHKIRNNVLMIGCDLSSNGGIASVTKALYSAYKTGSYDYDLLLLKTSHYKDRSIFFEFLLLISSFFNAIYFSLFRGVSIFHVHSSAHRSFYRKTIFILLGKILRKRIVLHLHSSDFYNFFLSNNRVVSYIVSLCDVVVVLCEDWREKFSAKYPQATVLKVENPYESNASVTKIPAFDCSLKVLFVGFLIENKGIRDLIKIAELLKKSDIQNIVIQIAGKGDLEDHIKAEVEEKSLDNYIQFLGWISGSEKSKAFMSADAFILPSYKEGMPISILEAMSYGLPILSTKIAGIPDVVEEGINGYLYSPGDINGFFSGILELSRNLEARQRMYLNNIDRVKENESAIIFAQIDMIYANLVAR